MYIYTTIMQSSAACMKQEGELVCMKYDNWLTAIFLTHILQCLLGELC